MGWFKETVDLFRTKKQAVDARANLAEVQMDLYIGLMKARDPSLTEEELDKSGLVKFLASVPGRLGEEGIPHAIKALSNSAWEIRWAALSKLVELNREIQRQQASGRPQTVEVETLIDHVGQCLNDPDVRVRANAEMALETLKRYVKE